MLQRGMGSGQTVARACARFIPAAARHMGQGGSKVSFPLASRVRFLCETSDVAMLSALARCAAWPAILSAPAARHPAPISGARGPGDDADESRGAHENASSARRAAALSNEMRCRGRNWRLQRAHGGRHVLGCAGLPFMACLAVRGGNSTANQIRNLAFWCCTKWPSQRGLSFCLGRCVALWFMPTQTTFLSSIFSWEVACSAATI